MVNWDAAHEAKLFALILQHADVKLTGELLGKVAEAMGEGCTAKAITHRIAKLKSAAATAQSNGDASTSTTTKAATPKKTPAKRGRKKKELTPDADDNEEENLSASPKKKVKAETTDEA